MLHKIYGAPSEKRQRRYSPAKCIGSDMKTVIGGPDPEHVSTSYVERQNLTMRMSMRRFTRLTNGFSKKVENHAHAVALHYMHYNFCRIHQSLRVTPAMEAGLADHVWNVEELVALIPKPIVRPSRATTNYSGEFSGKFRDSHFRDSASASRIRSQNLSTKPGATVFALTIHLLDSKAVEQFPCLAPNCSGEFVIRVEDGS